MFRQALLGGVVLFPVLIYVQYYAVERERAVSTLGVMCCSVGVIAYGAPLSAMVSNDKNAIFPTFVGFPPF